MENDPFVLQIDDVNNFSVNTSNEYLERVVRQVDLDTAGAGYCKSEYFGLKGVQ